MEMLVQKIRILRKVYLLKMQVVGSECETWPVGCGQWVNEAFDGLSFLDMNNMYNNSQVGACCIRKNGKIQKELNFFFI
jgi:hypothetical protein